MHVYVCIYICMCSCLHVCVHIDKPMHTQTCDNSRCAGLTDVTLLGNTSVAVIGGLAIFTDLAINGMSHCFLSAFWTPRIHWRVANTHKHTHTHTHVKVVLQPHACLAYIRKSRPAMYWRESQKNSALARISNEQSTGANVKRTVHWHIYMR